MHTTNAYLAQLLKVRDTEIPSLDECNRDVKRADLVSELILKNLELGVKMAFSMLSKWRFQLPKGEVESIAYLALCEAASRFDDKRGVAFGTFLFSYVRGHLLKEITASYNRKKRFVLVGDEKAAEGPSDLETPEQSAVRRELISILKKARQKLTSLENDVLERCFGDDKTVVDIAEELGYSRGHVSRMKSEALTLLTECFQARLAA